MNGSVNYSISCLNFLLCTPHPLRTAEAFVPFKKSGRESVTISFREVSRISAPAGVQVFRDDTFAVYDCGGTYIRLYHLHGGDLDAELSRIMASVSYDWGSGTGEVQYIREKSDIFSDSKGCFAHIGFEDILMSRGRLALHASLIETPFGGILFSGPSGIGKSTQADLWHCCEGSTVLNGDRPILYQNGSTWEAHGSPFAGSSHIYVNRGAPIRAIILLEQGSACRLHEVSAREAFCRLYEQTAVNIWNERYVTRVCDLLQNLIEHVPVYHYCCTADETAVRVLKEELLKGER